MRKEIKSVSLVVPDNLDGQMGRSWMGRNKLTEEILGNVAQKLQDDFRQVAWVNGIVFRGHIDQHESHAVEGFLPLDVALYLVRDIRRQFDSLLAEIGAALFARELHKIAVVSLAPLPPNVEDFLPSLQWKVSESVGQSDQNIVLPMRVQRDHANHPLIFEQAQSCTREWTEQLFEGVVSEKERCGEWN